MNMCSFGHDAVVYDTYDCPCCTMLSEIEKLNDRIGEYDISINELQYQLKELESQIPVE